MTRSKVSKILALAICLAMLIMTVPFSASAEATLTIDGITKGTADADGLVEITVNYTASTEVEQVTILAVAGGATAPDATEANIKYIDQEAKDGQYKFFVDEDDFSTETPNLFIKLGGTALTSATPGQDPVVIAEAITKFKVFGYVDVPVAVGATVSLGEGLTATTDATGKFEITNVDPGTYSLAVTAKSALARAVPVTVVDADVEVSLSTNKISLMFGDIDSSGKIDNSDLLTLKGLFNKTTISVGFDTNADLDSSGKIDNSDLLTLKGYFNKIPTNYPVWVK